MHLFDLAGYFVGIPQHLPPLIEARIIAVVDIFQALTQDRPYRKALEIGEIVAHLQQLAAEGKIDRDLVNLVADNLDTTWHAGVVSDQKVLSTHCHRLHRQVVSR